MAITSKVEICNLALGNLGNFGTVSDIDSGTSSKELTFMLWYDISRQVLLKMMNPSFAQDRAISPQIAGSPAFGYTNWYQRPTKCLKVLGIGDLDLRDDDYTIESNRILTNYDYPNGMPIRIINDVEDVNQMSPEFKLTLARFLALNVALEITQDIKKDQLIQQKLQPLIVAACGLDAQENRPIRISRSSFQASRVNGNGFVPGKR